MKRFFNEKGISFIEVIIASAILVGVAMGMMQLQKNMTNTVTTAETGGEITTIISEMRALLASTENCKKSFEGMSASDTDFGTIQKLVAVNQAVDPPTEKDRYVISSVDPDTRYGQGRIKIEAYALNDSADDVDVAEHLTNLYVRFYRGKASIQTESTKRIKLWVEVDGSGAIVTCRSLSTTENNIWTRNNNDQHNIYYDGGKVVIGDTGDVRPKEITVTGHNPDASDVTTWNSLNTLDVVSKTGQAAAIIAGVGDPWTYASVNLCTIKDSVDQNKCWNILQSTSAFAMGNHNPNPFNDGENDLSFHFTDPNLPTPIPRVVFRGNSARVGIGTMRIGPESLIDATQDYAMVHVDAGTGQAGLWLRGDGVEGGAPHTHSQISFGGLDKAGFSDNWYIAHKHESSGVDGAQPGSLEIGRGLGDVPDYLSILRDSKNIGIGDRNPAERLTVAGNIKADGDIIYNGSVTPSDIRYKKEIEPIKNPLKIIKEINGVSYFFRTEEFPKKNFKDTKQFGVIAQEVEKVLPEIVSENKEGFKRVDYQKLIPILLESIKELEQRVESLESQLKNKK